MTPREAGAWRWDLRGRTLVVTLGESYRVLSWAPLRAGLRRATLLGNHQIAEGDRAATDAPARYLSGVVRGLGGSPSQAVMMMTGANIRHVGYACARDANAAAAAWCTAGCANALRVGDRATVRHSRVGTINLIVVVSEPLSVAATAEAMHLAVEGRVASLHAAGVRSTVSRGLATGTGTDCIVVASPVRKRSIEYCGKHTRLGELIGRAVLKSCGAALKHRIAP